MQRKGATHHEWRWHRRSAFTLVELMATIAIIGVVMAMLLPAVQTARESARRTHCMSNLKQIGVGVQLYARAYGDAFPPGQVSPYVNVNNASGIAYSFGHGSTTMYLLPFIEQINLYSGFYTGEPPLSSATLPSVVDGIRLEAPTATYIVSNNVSNGWAKIPGSTTQICKTSVATYMCPSDYEITPVAAAFTNSNSNYRNARLNYISCAGPQSPWNPCSDPSLAPGLFNTYKKNDTGSVGVPGVFGTFSDMAKTWGSAPNKIFSISDCRCRIAAVRDGLSNTILFGEVRPDCSFPAHLGWCSTGNGCGQGNTLIPLNYDSCNTAAKVSNSDCSIPYNDNPAGFGFKSRHPGGVSILMGDGVVKFINDDIDYATFQRLGAKADGELLTDY